MALIEAAAILELLARRSRENWLLQPVSSPVIGTAGPDFSQQLLERSQFCREVLGTWGEQRPSLLLSHRQPLEFLARLLAACDYGCPVWLANPDWSRREWQQVYQFCRPDLTWTEGPLPSPALSGQPTQPLPLEPGWIMIPTGGSSGQVRFAVHTWQTLTAAVVGWKQFWSDQPLSAICTLPLHHVSGLMQCLRALLTGGQVVSLPWQRLDASPPDPILTELELGDFLLSLVPTQLQRLLDRGGEASRWLPSLRAVVLGGAPAWPELLAQSAAAQIPLALTYGMTETAAGITLLPPMNFRQGQQHCGGALPHAQVTILDPMGQVVQPQGETGTITLQTEALALGYFSSRGYEPLVKTAWGWLTDDLGRLDAEGNLQIVGRQSQKIITGGENVYPIDIEAALRATGLVQDVCVFGLPDREWGEVVTAVYVPNSQVVDPDQLPALLKQTLAAKLSRFKLPRCWVGLEYLPRNAQGKIDDLLLKQLALERLAAKDCSPS